ncbi:T9SS type B sorting domain-containing protein [Galbibacter sp. PAP.153]|uniref:T9SS type B sorting domain-containing protein n=1 Tax=Galbibacter sp. PAP.153 TaxID=3104623 RepID=UPI00300A9C4C
MRISIRISIGFILLCCNFLFAQKESANWYFGEKAGLSFNTEPPTVMTNGQLVTNEGCATISDKNGNLLFYTDGVSVWNRRHQKMPNGTGLLGHSSSTESAIIIPKPGASNSYYVFTIDKPSYYLTEDEPIDGINYSEIDMTLDGGYGDIVAGEKNIHLVTYDASSPIQKEYKSSEKITAVSHSNGTSIWVITFFMNKFYAFEVDGNGVNTSPVISTVNEAVGPLIDKNKINISAIGYLKVSPNGKKIAIAHSSTRLGNERSSAKKSGKLLIYDFNNSTGKVTNEKLILNNEYPYGLEFSPNSKLLYATSGIYNKNDGLDKSYIYQYDLGSSNISGTKKIINESDNVPGALQLAINGKIYRAGYKVSADGTHLSVINKPNEIGNASIYSHNSVFLEGKFATLGLPPFIQSIFKYTFDFKNLCYGDTTEFEITTEDPYDTAEWDFGDGSTSNDASPTHQYAMPGNYTVTLYLSTAGRNYDPLIKQITISEPPQVINGTYELSQCDSFDNNPNDGQTTYNLSNANADITLNTTDFINVNYYHSITEAENDSLNLDYINPIYRNTQPNELLYAKVFGIVPECYNIVPIELTTSTSSNLSTYTQQACDLDDTGTAIFDLSEVRANIISNLNLPGITEVSFYKNQQDASIGTNGIADFYESSTASLYYRVEHNNECYGGGIVEISTKAFPVIQDQEIDICASEFPIEISSGLNTPLSTLYNYQWNTNQETNTITVYQPGLYELRVTDPTLDCEKTIQVKVNQIEPPYINNIKIDDRNIEVILSAPIDGYEFSVDNQFDTFQASNQFEGLEPGNHTLFVRDINNCTTISQEFSIIGFPHFFTPNNDGANDTWNIYGLDDTNFLQTIHIYIYDRYGKLINSFNPLNSNGWNGKYHGQLMPPDDYWYYLKLPNAKEYKGHFSLKI